MTPWEWDGQNPRRYELIRPEIRRALDRWAESAHPIGHFLTAVVSNDLMNAVAYADDQNLIALPAILTYLYNEFPSGCWGSPKKVEGWINDHRINSREEI